MGRGTARRDGEAFAMWKCAGVVGQMYGRKGMEARIVSYLVIIMG